MKIKGKKNNKVLQEHGKQLAEYSKEKEPPAHSKQEEICEDIVNKRMRVNQDLSKKVNFNNLTYHYNVKNDPKNVIGFKGPLYFYRSI